MSTVDTSKPVQNVKLGPQAVADSGAVAAGTSVTINVSANDLAQNATSLWSLDQADPGVYTAAGTSVTLSSGASVSFVDGQVVYSTGSAFSSLPFGVTATDTFTYGIRMANGSVSYNTVTVTVTGSNHAPDAIDDAQDVPADSATVIPVTANDTDVDGNPLTVIAVTQPATRGVVTIDGSGQVVFDPDGQFDALSRGHTEPVSFTYTISDGAGGSDTATVTLSVVGANHGPDAVDDDLDAADSGTTVLAVLGNDTDYDGDTPIVTAVTQPSEGSVSIVAGQVVFDPGSTFVNLSAGETATVTFSYSISDGFGGTDTANVSLDVIGAGTFVPTNVSDTDSGTLASNGQTVNMTLSGPGQANDEDADYSITVGLGLVAQPIINVVYVVDVSGSTQAQFPGTSVGNQNPTRDGLSNTILDAEIASLRALTNAIAALGFPAPNVTVTVIAFQATAINLGTTNIGNVAGINATLSNLQLGGGTNYEAALQATISALNTLDPGRNENNLVYFLSDGLPASGGSTADEMAFLTGTLLADVSAFGLGSAVNLAALNPIDNTGGAQLVTSTTQLDAALLGSPIPSGSVTDFELLVDGVAIPGIDEADLVPNVLGLTLNVTVDQLDPYLGNDTTLTAIITFTGGTTLTAEIDVVGAMPYSTNFA